MESLILGQVTKPGLNPQPNSSFQLQKCSFIWTVRKILVSTNEVVCHKDLSPYPRPKENKVMYMIRHPALPQLRQSELAWNNTFFSLTNNFLAPPSFL